MLWDAAYRHLNFWMRLFYSTIEGLFTYAVCLFYLRVGKTRRIWQQKRGRTAIFLTGGTVMSEKTRGPLSRTGGTVRKNVTRPIFHRQPEKITSHNVQPLSRIRPNRKIDISSNIRLTVSN